MAQVEVLTKKLENLDSSLSIMVIQMVTYDLCQRIGHSSVDCQAKNPFSPSTEQVNFIKNKTSIPTQTFIFPDGEPTPISYGVKIKVPNYPKINTKDNPRRALEGKIRA